MTKQDQSIEAYPGQPATVSIGSDRYAAEVVEVSPTGFRVTIRYKSPGLENQTFCRRRRDGAYRNGSYALHLGVAEDYRDPSF